MSTPLARRSAPSPRPAQALEASPFHSFFMGGFECSSHRRGPGGPRLDLIAATRHDVFAVQDFLALQRLGIRTVRDGIRWHRVESRPNWYSFSSDLPLIRAARQTGMQVIWDVCHYGWPDDLSPFSARFSRRLANLAKAFIRVLLDEGEAQPLITPFNEPSFVSWIGGTLGQFPPFARNRGDELKRCIVRAIIECIDAVREVAPRARICLVDPMIHIVQPRNRPDQQAEVDAYRQAQFAAWDMIGGYAEPELGGQKDYLDLIGVNYYVQNQWVHQPEKSPAPILKPGDPRHRPVSELLREIFERYRRPVFIAETGIEGRARARWLRYMADESFRALQQGVPLYGLCLYPVIDYPGWADDRHCPTGLLGYAADCGTRPVCRAFARELHLQQHRLTGLASPAALKLCSR